MKKYILSFIIIFIISHSNNVLGQVLDSANIKCNYKLKFIKDTLNKLDTAKDDQVLLIGSDVNQYFSYTNYKSDSTLKEFIAKQEKTGNADISKAPDWVSGIFHWQILTLLTIYLLTKVSRSLKCLIKS